MFWKGKARQAGRGLESYGRLRKGSAGQVRRVKVCCGEVWRGLVRQVRHGGVWRGEARFGRHGQARWGVAR